MKNNVPKFRFSVADTMDCLNMGRNGVYEAVNSGELDSYLVKTRRYFNPTAVKAYAELKERQAKEREALS